MSISAAKAARAKTTAEPTAQRAARSAAPQPDLRPETVAQRKLQEDIRNSPRAQQAAGPAPVQLQENKTGLPDSLKSGVENLSGYSLDDVKVHYNSAKPAGLQAHAYAQGADIHLAPGQEKHLPHEAWHVAQQKQGRVQPTMQMKGGTNINDNAGLEKEADAMGQKALAAPRATAQLRGRGAMAGAPAQLVKDEGKRSITDTRVNDMKKDAISVLNKMLVLGEDWEMKYAQKGKEKGSSILSGEKTDYVAKVRRAALEEMWGSLTGEEKLTMISVGIRATGKVIGTVARAGTKAASGLLRRGEEREEEPQPEREESSSAVSWLSLLSQDDVMAMYEAYSRVNEGLNRYAEAKALIQKKGGEIGESLGGAAGKLRNESDFNKRMSGLRQEFDVARARYKLLMATITENADSERYEEEIATLEYALIQEYNSPYMVYELGSLTEEGRKKHAEYCQQAIEAIRASSHGHGELVESAIEVLSGWGAAIKGAFSSSAKKEQAQALKAAQSELATELFKVVNKSWGAFTKWRSTPTGVSAIKKALPGKPDDVAKLRDAVTRAASARAGKSDNRSSETQIFYDALATLQVGDLQSLKVTKSIIEEIGAKLG